MKTNLLTVTSIIFIKFILKEKNETFTIYISKEMEFDNLKF